MIVAVLKESAPGEKRVALVPEQVATLVKAGLTVIVQPDAGSAAGFADVPYVEKGARLSVDPIAQADILLKVRPPTEVEVGGMKENSVLIGLLQPHANRTGIKALAARKVSAIALELMPRITRAQTMDVLSSMSTIAGYKAVLIAANRLPRFFPLLMTAAGTISPARVLIIGAGVAGLQAIGTARRLGAVVEAYDTRPSVKEQVESLGAKFADLGLEAGTETAAGYAASSSEEFYEQQRERMTNWLATADVVITTALVPGQRAPILVTEAMVRKMRPGTVLVDLAAEQGGNCALTRPDHEVNCHGVIILGPLNLPSSVAFHASQMYSRNITSYLLHLLKDGRIHLDLQDELTRHPLLTHQGDILHQGPT